MNNHKVVRFWIDSAEKDWSVTKNLFKLKHYAYCLFFCHLTTEKLLKALVVQKTGKQAPQLHDLKRLAKLAGLKMTPEQRVHLEAITTFNIKARYDDVKQSFYQKATKSYAQEYLAITKEIGAWLKEILHSRKS
jgi:HEPN domain-containing protein